MAAPVMLDNVADRDILPKNVKPIHYDLTLELDVSSVDYSGKVAIELDVLEPTASITINCVDLSIDHASIDRDPLSSLPIDNEQKETAEITLHETLAPGSKVTLTLSFHGTLRDSLSGMFRSSYKDKDGSLKRIIVTEFAPVDARSAFPCFDEPALKATFSSTIITNKSLTCLSNMPEALVTAIGEDKISVTFEKTPVMSTYLVAFAVGEFAMIETNLFRIPLRVYTTSNNDVESGRWALELGAKALTFFEEKLGVAFPLPKMDLITIPNYMGAMENWGLITFREGMLLHDSETGTIALKRRIGDVVCHELSHQWFGNLVTMEFWDGLWLNEGFATWAAMYSCDIFFPVWNARQHFLATKFQQALNLDSLRSSHPVETPVKNPDDIGQIFDGISYSKGCCLISMIAEYIGEDVFFEGMKQYLHKYQYGNALTVDLWAALSEASGIDVAAIMSKWTLNVGYPVVTVTEDDDSIHLKQSRFLRIGGVKPEEDQVIYSIPLNMLGSQGRQTKTWFNTREAKIPVESDFLKLNAKQVGFYRTAYSSKRLRALGNQMEILSVEDRVGIVSDAVALAPAGYQSTSAILSLLEKYQGESIMIAWKQVVVAIESIRLAWLFEDENIQEGLRTFQRQLVSPKAHELGWDLTESDDEEEQQLKVLLFRASALSGDEKTKQAAFDMFKRFMDGDRLAIHSDLQAAVFDSVLEHSTSNENYEAMLELFRASKTSDERDRAITALGYARDPGLVQRTLEMLLEDEVEKREVNLPLQTISRTRDGQLSTWKWMQENADGVGKKLAARIGTIMGVVINSCGGNFSSEEAVKEFESFWETKNTAGFDRGISQCAEEIRVKVNWLAHGREDVRKWLQEKGFI